MQKKKNRYMDSQILEGFNHHAGSKARRDIVSALKQNGWEEICFVNEQINYKSTLIRQFKSLFSILQAFLRMKKNSLLVMQYPLEKNSPKIFNLLLPLFKKLKKIKCIVIIHDLDSIRFRDKISYEIENKNLSIFDNIISHSQNMTNFITNDLRLNKNINELHLFDYLSDFEGNPVNMPINRIVFAGNLTKSSFCKELKNIKGLEFNLYGAIENEEKIIGPNVHYNGLFTSEEIVRKLEGSWGLLWDGDSLETCSGKYGEYLKYNASHKNSLYIVAGLPLIVWKDAAIATYVLEHNIGIVVSSLYEIHEIITNMSYDDYQIKKTNVKKIATKLKNGDNILHTISVFT